MIQRVISLDCGMRQLAQAEKKLHIVVYPKVLYKGKLMAPQVEE